MSNVNTVIYPITLDVAAALKPSVIETQVGEIITLAVTLTDKGNKRDLTNCNIKFSCLLYKEDRTPIFFHQTSDDIENGINLIEIVDSPNGRFNIRLKKDFTSFISSGSAEIAIEKDGYPVITNRFAIKIKDSYYSTDIPGGFLSDTVNLISLSNALKDIDELKSNNSNHGHNNMSALNIITDNKIREWNDKASHDHTHQNFAPINHDHNMVYAAKITEHTHENQVELNKVKSGDIETWNNKVDKVFGSSLVEDTDILKLKTLENYDDTDIRNIISQKPNPEDLHAHSNINELNKFVTGDKGNLDEAYAHSTLSHAPSNAEANVQPDWNITDTSSDAYIKNKPNIPAATQVVDNLISADTDKALSANQGKVLDEKIRQNTASMADITNDLNSHIQNHPSGGSSVTFRDVVDGEIFELSTTSQPTVNVTEVSLNKTTTIVPTGSTDTLIATVLPSNASNKAVTWTSSNTSIATVNNGVIIGVANGTCTITVTTIDGSKTATCNVTVETVTIPLTSISLKSTSSLTVNATEQLIVIFNPSNATNKSITWSSSDTNKATVVNGLVTAKAEGNVVITATSQDGNKTASCSYTITAIQEGYKLDGLELWVDTKNGSGSDTTLIDKSGKGNDLTLEGFDFDNTTNGWINGGLKFKRTSKITKTNFDGLNCYEKSIEMVFDTAVLSDIQNYLQLKRTSDSKGVALITNASSTTFSASYENTSGSIVFNSNNITGKLKDNTKHHFIMILRSNGDLVGFIDGTKIIFPKSDFSKWIQISPYNLIVGATTYGSTLMTLYQLRIYSNALTDEEALNNYNCYLGGM